MLAKSLISLGLLANRALAATCPGVAAARYPYQIAQGWAATKVAAGLTQPRDLAIDSAGRLLIVEAGSGVSVRQTDSTGCVTTTRTLISRTALNHGIYLSPDERTLYVSSATTVWGYPYNVTSGTVGTSATTLVTGMYTSGHQTRTLIVPLNNPSLLVISHGSDENLDQETVDPRAARAIVKVFDLSKVPSSGYSYVTGGWNAGYGLRNEVALSFDLNNMLWGVENSADSFQRTVNGISYSIVTDNPAEELNYLGDVSVPNNKWYGYPTCFTVGNPTAFTDRAFKTGDQFVLAPNGTFSDDTCIGISTPPRLSLPAHTAPLGSKFDNTNANLFVALHGSWNRTPPQGYKVVAIPFRKSAEGAYEPVAAQDNARGFSDVFFPNNENACSATSCARPVGLAFDGAGRLYFTSDSSGEVFFLQKTT